MPGYAGVSTDSPEVIEEVVLYGRIVCTLSIGLFLESVWTKALQAEGNMRTPMIAQVLGAVQTCIAPVISFNYAAHNLERCKKTLVEALIFGMGLMFIGTLCFVFIPVPMLHVFTHDEAVISICRVSFPIQGISFIPLVSSLTFPVFFPGRGGQLQELRSDGHPHSGALRPPGLALLPVRPELFLAHLPGDGGYHHQCWGCVLSAVFAEAEGNTAYLT